MNIKENPTPNTISIPMDVKESARHIAKIQYIEVEYISIPLIMYESAVIKKNSQYIKVKYNSIPLIINENVFIYLEKFYFCKNTY